MPSIQSYSLLLFLQYLKKKNKNKVFTLRQKRKLLDRMGDRFPLTEGVKQESLTLANVPVECLYPAQISNNRLLVYFHGGAYQLGSIRSHRGLVSRIASMCQSRAMIIDYRLSPENPFPAALEDAHAVYQAILSREDTSSIILLGDSAGGGLSLATLLYLKEQKAPMPKAMVLISPWVDLAAQNETLDSLAAKDPVLSKAEIMQYAQEYYQNHSPYNPLISPIYGDLADLPPMLIQVGTQEILLGEAKLLAKKIQQTGGQVKLAIWKNMFHVWHFAGERLPEAKKAFKEIADFLNENV